MIFKKYFYVLIYFWLCWVTEKAMATHSSVLAWRIPWIEEPGRLESMGSSDWADTTALGLHCWAGLSLVAASNGWSPLQCVGFPLQRLLLLQSAGSRMHGLRFLWCLGSTDVVPRLQSTGSGVWHLGLVVAVQSLSRVQLCNPLDVSMPGSVLHCLPEFAQLHVHCVSDAIQPSHPRLPLSPSFNLSQHQGFF